ncbi:hypothetical protein BHF71_09690 [Vulcanibacillus modesticaldus]|uniref:YetF C-terminal domain-containing protein n=1 Tax=Vulcanibacillus modesticaldus TaxID=337097 RepID=A0A1D2YU80_9BACI|nr:YetF domain-containing protein [Vulcanibacillus modesticaldus]OEF99211.1 hypothetical protein BHF71_09690 [Vulcanibacillus modesticaldus]
MEWLKIVGISLVMISLGFTILKVIAKRSLNEMSIFNIFLILMLANILSEPLKTNNLIELIIPVTMIVVTFFIYSYLLSTNKWAKKIKNDPIVLIRHGNIDEKGLSKAKMTITEILAELRYKGYAHVKDVEFAILEETGKISIIPNVAKRPVNTSDLSIVTGYEGVPVPLIIDGAIQYDNLAKINLSPEQLIKLLGMQGYSLDMIKTISLAVLDENKRIVIDQNDDINQGNIDQKQQSLTKKIQEDIKAGKKEPEDQDLGPIDDYIKI